MAGGIISRTRCPPTEPVRSLQSHPNQKCLIAVGGNLHNSPQIFRDALAQLHLAGCRDVEISRLKRTRAAGENAGNDFLNAAAVLQTSQSPEELLNTLHQIEMEFGRTRLQHWGPRTLDLDLILYGDVALNSPQLVVPHPAMWYRRFVLDPAVEVASEMVHPILGESIARLHARLCCRPLNLELCAHGPASQTSDCDKVLDSVRGLWTDLQWSVVESETQVSPDVFARISLQPKQPRSGIQPFNPAGREVVVVGSVSEMVSEIEQLKKAMLG